MSKKAKRLLDRARNAPSGWKRVELDALYMGFGFTIESRAKHDMAYHEDYLEDPQLRAMIPRHTKVNPAYVKQAVKLIEHLITLQNEPLEEEEEQEDDDAE